MGIAAFAFTTAALYLLIVGVLKTTAWVEREYFRGREGRHATNESTSK